MVLQNKFSFVQSLAKALLWIPAIAIASTLPSGPYVTRTSGGSVQTKLSDQIVLNKGSALQREWIAVNNGSLPVQLVQTPGVTTIYEREGRYSSGGYEYKVDFNILVAEPITAIEVRFLTFNIWGERERVLSLTEILDFGVGTHKLTGSWSLYSENEASEFYASIAYVARVRTASGKIVTADLDPILAEARKFNAKFSEAELDREPGKKD